MGNETIWRWCYREMSIEAFQSCKYISYTNTCSPGVLCAIFVAKEMSRPGTSLGPARGTGLLPAAVVRRGRGFWSPFLRCGGPLTGSVYWQSFWGHSMTSFKMLLWGFIIFLTVYGFSWLIGALLTWKERERGEKEREEGSRRDEEG